MLHFQFQISPVNCCWYIGKLLTYEHQYYILKPYNNHLLVPEYFYGFIWIFYIDNNVKQDIFLSSFPVYILLIFFHYYTALANASRAVLKKNGERRHPCLIPDLSGKASSFSSLSIMLAVEFF